MPANDLSQQQYHKMTETPIPRLILSLAAPTILSMLITSIYNLADTFFVGQLSTSASGAVGIVSSLMAIIQALGFMFGHGAGGIISRSRRQPGYPRGHQICLHQLFHGHGGGCRAGRGRPCHPAPLYDAAGQHGHHPAPRQCLRPAHPVCGPADDVQPCDEQHPASMRAKPALP